MVMRSKGFEGGYVSSVPQYSFFSPRCLQNSIACGAVSVPNASYRLEKDSRIAPVPHPTSSSRAVGGRGSRASM